MHRKSALAVLLSVVTALGALNLACSRSGSPVADDVYEMENKEDSLSFDLNDPKVKQRLGDDDGYALALMYSADTDGSLETCG